jgi:hypothetical protein
MGFGTPPWLGYAGPTMATRAWLRPSPRQLEDLRQPLTSFGVSSLIQRLSDEWMQRPFGIVTLNRPRGVYVKGEVELTRNRAEPAGLGQPAWARFGPGSLPKASCPIVDLHNSACGPLMLSSPQIR